MFTSGRRVGGRTPELYLISLAGSAMRIVIIGKQGFFIMNSDFEQLIQSVLRIPLNQNLAQSKAIRACLPVSQARSPLTRCNE